MGRVSNVSRFLTASLLDLLGTIGNRSRIVGLCMPIDIALQPAGVWITSAAENAHTCQLAVRGRLLGHGLQGSGIEESTVELAESAGCCFSYRTRFPVKVLKSSTHHSQPTERAKTTVTCCCTSGREDAVMLLELSVAVLLRNPSNAASRSLHPLWRW